MLVFFLALLLLLQRSACAALGPGSLAITGWVDNGAPDQFSFITLAPIAAGEVVYFTDNGWIGSPAAGSFRGATPTVSRGAEDLLKWTAINAIPAGLIINSGTVSPDFVFDLTSHIPSASSPDFFSNLALSQTGDQITAFQASSATDPLLNVTTALFTLDDSGGFENATSSITGNVALGLASGITALTFDQKGVGQNFMNFQKASLASGTPAEWQAAIDNPANWKFASSGTLETGSINVVPEIGGAWCAILGGLGLLIFQQRFRRL